MNSYFPSTCLYMALGLLIWPMKRMLRVDLSRMKTKKDLSSYMISGIPSGTITKVIIIIHAQQSLVGHLWRKEEEAVRV